MLISKLITFIFRLRQEIVNQREVFFVKNISNNYKNVKHSVQLGLFSFNHYE